MISIFFIKYRFDDKFECYAELLKVINRIASLKFVEVKYLKKVLKFLYRTILVEENLERLKEAGGAKEILNILNAWLNLSKDHLYVSFSGIKWAIAILIDIQPSMSLKEFTKKLLELAYYGHSLVFESEIPKSKLNTPKQQTYLLKNTLKIPLYVKENEISDKRIKDLVLGNDLRTISVVLQVIELTFIFIERLAKNSQECLGWALASLYFSIYRDIRNYDYLVEYFEIEQVVIMPLNILKNVITKQAKYHLEVVLRKLMGNYLFELIAINDGKPNEKKVLEYLNNCVYIPQLVWDDKNRKELRGALKNYLLGYFNDRSEDYIGTLKTFEYEVYKNEIIIDSIFIKAINANPLLPFDKVVRFLKDVFNRLEKLKGQYLKGKELKIVVPIIEALRNTILNQKFIEFPEFSSAQINTLVEYLLPIKMSIENKDLELIRINILEFLIEVSRESKHITLLTLNKNLIHFALYHLCYIQDNPIDNLIFTLIQNMFTHNEGIKVLIDYNYFIPLFNIFFDSKANEKCKAKAMSCLMKFLVHDTFDSIKNHISNYIPYPILEQLAISWSKKIKEVLSFIDNDYIDPYITWNKELRVKVREELQKATQEIALTIEKGNSYKFEEESKIFPRKGELVVDDVIIANYIKVPFSKLHVII